MRGARGDVLWVDGSTSTTTRFLLVLVLLFTLFMVAVVRFGEPTGWRFFEGPYPPPPALAPAAVPPAFVRTGPRMEASTDDGKTWTRVDMVRGWDRDNTLLYGFDSQELEYLVMSVQVQQFRVVRGKAGRDNR